MPCAKAAAAGAHTLHVGSWRAICHKSLTSVETNGTLHASASFTELGHHSVSDVQSIRSHAAAYNGSTSCGKSFAMRSSRSPRRALAISKAAFASEKRLM